ncbi:TetR/AcrR family transcriptional regulator [Rhizobium sp. 16-449-1b]|uniref:TetR/AcrR family transcriptional regulator n=1 Tax=Rhizobium sp. 16-449-1b TaxID=2819989 RepID=UPI001ADBB3FF|nr:TetR/AcrR family transcriptional regulator [Rhizobium sp. 16-449-1b]MBO9198603.1 TetR/AcrR family transcriptional regulator [Rhizobium sp. 16-449-1b]
MLKGKIVARTGRPREFDRQKALDAAVMLFWAQGYEPTSLNQLKESMGNISPASFYAAFGSKEALFREVVARYLDVYGQTTSSLRDRSLPPREAVETALTRSACMQTEPVHPPGCLIVMGASNCTPQNRHIDEILRSQRAADRKAIEECVSRAVASGELSQATNVKALSTPFSSFLMGIPTEVRDGATKETLLAAIATLMTLWDLHKRPNS